MAKYNQAFKLGVVKAYLNGEGSYPSLAKDSGITDEKSIRNWVRIYEAVGEKGLKRTQSQIRALIQKELVT
ncbi:helix-turn-helix domain-containing protein [Gracilibacillus sp. YIM 98692]|uniref:helix-turn-helix domain-containing protein n=1 Tax=Gracilibacillus sp. YIM 98692 TaxID=2663532 RepID=UPI0013D89A85|nr:helix-turn-helix domain-containing protein [Gracilibacillus sp. YIM 98692]